MRDSEVIHRAILLSENFPIFLAKDHLTALFTEVMPKTDISEQLSSFGGKILDVVRLKQQARNFWLNELANSSHVTGQNRFALRHGFEWLQRSGQFGQAYAAAWIGHHIHQRIVTFNLFVRDGTYRAYVFLRPGFADGVLYLRQFFSLTDK